MKPSRPRIRKIGNGTFAAVIREYFAKSAKFNGMAESSKRVYRLYLTIAQEPEHLGAYSVEALRPSAIQGFLDNFADRPSTQQLVRATLKAVEQWALTRDYLPHPITIGTETEKSDGGHVPWTETQFQLARQHCSPAMVRAITLQGNTGQRGSDIVRMRWTDIEIVNGRMGINVVQQKTGVELWVPFTRAFEAEIAQWERRPGFILIKPDGRPFKRKDLANRWILERRKIPELEPLKDLALHGLRGYCVVKYSHEGLSESQIANIVGMSVPMVARYRRKFLQKANALAAMDHLDGKNKDGTGTEEGLVVTFTKPK